MDNLSELGFNQSIPKKGGRLPTDLQELQRLSKHSPSYDSAYLHRYLDKLLFEQLVKLAVRSLKSWSPYFDAIAFTGQSGTLIAPPVARALGKALIMVRKTTKGCHSSDLVEGDRAARAYIIVDDQISSGDTQRKIRKRVKAFSPKAQCLGVLSVNYLYGPTIDKRVRKYGKYPLYFMKSADEMYGEPHD